MYIFKWCILWVLFPYLSTYSETVCTFSYYFSVISTQLDSQIGTLHQNAFPSRTKHFETLPFGKQRKRLSRQKFRISLFFPYSITHFRLPRWCWRTKDALKIIRAERKERGKKNRRGGWGWKVNLCDWGWWGPDKVSAHLFTPGGRRRFFKRQQLQSSISEESWMPKRKTAVIVVWFLQNDGDLFLEKRSKYFFFLLCHSFFMESIHICAQNMFTASTISLLSSSFNAGFETVY